MGVRMSEHLATWHSLHLRAKALRDMGKKEDAKRALGEAARILRIAERADPQHENAAWDLELAGALGTKTLREQCESIRGFYQDQGVWRG